MSFLKVEELEPRHLLSGTYFFAPSPPPQHSTAGPLTTWVAEPSRFVDFGGGHAGPVEPSRPGEGFVITGPSRDFTPHDFDARGPEASGLRTTFSWVIAERPQAPAPTAPQVGSSAVGAAPDNAGGSGPAKVDPGATPAAQPEPANSGHRPITVALPPVPETPPTQPNSQPILILERPVSVAGVPVIVPDLMTVRPPVRSAGDGGGAVAGPDPSFGRTPLSAPRAVAPPTAAVPDGGPTGDGPAPPAPLPGVLAGLPPSDPSLLERGLCEFLNQLGWVGQELTRPRDGVGLSPWVVAAAAAFAAWKIARRQLRQYAGVPVPDGNGLSGSHPDHPFAE